MVEREQLIEKHSFWENSIFLLKTYVLISKRSVQNLFSGLKKFRKTDDLRHSSIISISETDLWNPNDNEKNVVLTAGKIQNLRIAAQKFNGLHIKANEVFSFWKHLGNPNFGQGFVVGREIREGCVIPTIGGGLCQVSNAFYDAALKANFQIVERHQHTKIIKGSLAEKNRDATVKWNYVDLRFKSKFDFRIEVELTSEKFVVKFRSNHFSAEVLEGNDLVKNPSKINDCYSCGTTSCHLHPNKVEQVRKSLVTAYILDEKWVEYDDYISRNVNPEDVFILPLKKNRLFDTSRYQWKSGKNNSKVYLNYFGFYRALVFRLLKSKRNVFELSLQLDEKLAKAAAKKIPINAKHIVVSQNLLPFLYESGAFGGRTFDVLMNRLPLKDLHARLNFAHAIYENSKTLNDFRAPNQLVELEDEALTKARKIISPHAEIHEIFNQKIEKLSWTVNKSETSKGQKILFPASSLARKGAYEVRRLAKELNLSLVVSGNELEGNNFWEGISIEKFNGTFDEIGLVLFPTYIGNHPRQLLKAVSKNIPIVTTTASGLCTAPFVKIVNIGDYEAFKRETLYFLNS